VTENVRKEVVKRCPNADDSCTFPNCNHALEGPTEPRGEVCGKASMEHQKKHKAYQRRLERRQQALYGKLLPSKRGGSPKTREGFK
jgi:hypothetical protein